MSRLLGIAAACVLLLLGAASFAEHRWGVGARALGAESLTFRRETLAAVNAPPRGGALVAWFGDSTIASTEGIRAYPLLVQDREPAIASWLVAAMGLDPFGFWAVTEPVLAARPRAAVLIAHLRVWEGRMARPVDDLLDQVPSRDLPRAALLPLEARGISRLRLALAPLLGRAAVLDARVFLDGLQRGYRALWRATVPSATPPVAIGAWVFFDGMHGLLRAYDMPIRERTPALVMLGATVERLTHAGVPALVVVSPLPIGALRGAGRWHPERFRRRIARVRTVVERAGGRLLDLHDLLPEAEMRDTGGHATAAGHARLAAHVLPAIRALLDGGGR